MFYCTSILAFVLGAEKNLISEVKHVVGAQKNRAT